MSLIRLAYLYREILALVITTVASLFIFFTNSAPAVRAVQADLAGITKVIFAPQRWYRNILSVKEENRTLQETVVQLTLLNAKLMQYRSENEKLREMLRFTEESRLDLLPARIINQNLMASVHTLMIDVGKNSGLHADMGVMDVHGIIGKIISVGEKASEVQMITDKNYKISVRVGDSRELGIFSFDQGSLGKIDGIRKTLSLKAGAIVYTSGISDIYPADIPVARIVSTRQDENKAFQDIIVELLADIHNFDFVFVIKN